jgi:hypothetical protein
MGLPDFLIVGAMKSGTTTLAAQIGAQKGLFITTPKEPNFFSDDPVYAQGLDWYRSLFEPARPGDLKGEASTHYTKLPTYPDTVARARQALAEVKLVYMIRNPVARAVSHFIHEWSEGTVSDDMEAAFRTRTELIDYGLYARQIRPWIDAYGAGAVHLTSLEAMKADPQGTLEEVARFLGHSGPVAWVAEQEQANVSAERIRKLPLHGLLVRNPVAAFLRRTLVPRGLRDRIRQSRQMTRRPDLPEALRRRLEARFAEDHADLATLFPGHPTLALSYPFVDP